MNQNCGENASAHVLRRVCAPPRSARPGCRNQAAVAVPTGEGVLNRKVELKNHNAGSASVSVGTRGVAGVWWRR